MTRSQDPCSSNSFKMSVDEEDLSQKEQEIVKKKKQRPSNESDTERQLRLCKNLLLDLRNNEKHYEYAWIFYEPVDTEMLECPNYYEVIKNPMDMSTMEKKMDNGDYSTAQEFADDIKLMISNCELFNSPTHAIIPLCQKFKKVFEARFKAIMAPRIPNQRLLEESNSFLSKSSFTFNNILPDDKKYILRELHRTQEYTKKLLDKLQSIMDIEQLIDTDELMLTFNKPKPKNRNRRSNKDASNSNTSVKFEEKSHTKQEEQLIPETVPNSEEDEEMPEAMTYAEKQELTRNINNLPNENVHEVSEMIRKLAPECYAGNGAENFQIDFSMCPTNLLRKIEKYVYDFNHPKVPRAAPFPRKEKLEKDQELVQKLKKDLDAEQKKCENQMAKVQGRLGELLKQKMQEKFNKMAGSSSSSDSDSSSSSTTSGSSSSDTDE